jgi:hypothetical protein
MCITLFFWTISSRLMSTVVILLSEGQISPPYRGMGRASALYTFILEDFWTQVRLKCCLKFLILKQNFLVLLNVFFIFIGNSTTKIFKILYLLTFVIHYDFTSYWILSWKCHRLRFFSWYFHFKIFCYFCYVITPLCKLSSESASINW